jgi:hypothetical protein
MWKSTIFLTLILFVSLVFAEQVCIDSDTYYRAICVMVVSVIFSFAVICTFITFIILSCLGVEMSTYNKKKSVEFIKN